MSRPAPAFLKNLYAPLAAAARETASTPFYYVLALLVALFVLAVRGTGWLIGEPARIRFSVYQEEVYATSFVALAGFILCRVLYLMIVRRPARLARAIADDLGTSCFDPRRYMGALVILLLFPVFFSVFTSFKSILPDINPFSWDDAFTRMDAWLHGGRQPWEILHPVLGFPLVTLIVNQFYQLWFFTKFFVLYWQGFSRHDLAQRAQFFLTLLTSWIVNGAVFATIFSSAGPCYYALLHPGTPDPFAPLMDYFAAADSIFPMWNIVVQQRLWDIHMGHTTTTLAGISAFPSMHVSVAFAFLLAAWTRGIAWRAVFLAFFMFTMIGSIHLGWHYAVDGYFSVVTTLLIWLGWGWLVRRYALHRPRLGQAPEDLRQDGDDLVDLLPADNQGR